MRAIDLNGEAWTKYSDFYQALLTAVGAPDWHGISIDALVDSMIWGGINTVCPPYVVRVHNIEAVPMDVRDEIAEVGAALAEARQEFRARKQRDVEVSLKIISGKMRDGW